MVLLTIFPRLVRISTASGLIPQLSTSQRTLRNFGITSRIESPASAAAKDEKLTVTRVKKTKTVTATATPKKKTATVKARAVSTKEGVVASPKKKATKAAVPTKATDTRVKAKKAVPVVKGRKRPASAKGYPPPPRYQGSGFAQFIGEFRAKNAAQPVVSTLKDYGKFWHELSEEERSAYNERGRESWAKYNADMKEYVAGLDEFQLREVRRDYPSRPGLSSPDTLAVLPKRPLGPFPLFVRDFRNDESLPAQLEGLPAKTANFTTVTLAAKKWNSLSDDEKLPYLTTSKKAMAEWIEKHGFRNHPIKPPSEKEETAGKTVSGSSVN